MNESSNVSTPIWAETMGEGFGVKPSRDGTSVALHSGSSGKLQDAETTGGARGTKPEGTDQSKILESSQNLSGDEAIAASFVSNHVNPKKKKRPTGSKKRRNQLERLAAGISDETSNEAANRKRHNDGEINGHDEKRNKNRDVGVRMAIVSEGNSKNITLEMVNPIRIAIWETLENTPDPLPVINAGTLIAGVLHFSCEGTTSARWLHCLTGTVIEGIKLKVISAKDLPKPVKMAWKTRNTWCLDVSKLLNIMQRFNPLLNTNDWKVVNTLVEESHVRRIVLMDKASADFIKTREYCLHTGMDQSIFKLLEEPDRKIGDSELKIVPLTLYQNEFDLHDIWEEM